MYHTALHGKYANNKTRPFFVFLYITVKPTEPDPCGIKISEIRRTDLAWLSCSSGTLASALRMNCECEGGSSEQTHTGFTFFSSSSNSKDQVSTLK
jgi:hypothetical protein